MIDAIVTGATGFIGSRLVDALRAQGCDLLALSSADGDVADSAFWAGLPAARVLFHLAGRTYVPDSWNEPAAFVTANVVGAEQAITYCARTNAHLVFASAYLYGIPKELPIQETAPVEPNNPYALSKYLAEQLISFATTHRNLSATVLRLFNVYGPGQRQDFLLPRIISQVRAGMEVCVHDLSPKRDFVHVDDVVSAFLKASEVRRRHLCVNLGSGASHSVAQLINMVQQASGKILKVIESEQPRQNEIADVRADITLARRELEWVPLIPLERGISEMLR